MTQPTRKEALESLYTQFVAKIRPIAKDPSIFDGAEKEGVDWMDYWLMLLTWGNVDENNVSAVMSMAGYPIETLVELKDMPEAKRIAVEFLDKVKRIMS